MKIPPLMLSALIAGCLTSTVYVCPDGSAVDMAEKCAAPTTLSPLAESPQCAGYRNALGEPDDNMMRRCQLHMERKASYCMSLPSEQGDQASFGRTACLIELAALTNDSTTCDSLDGNTKILCEARAKKDIQACERIPVPDIQEACREKVYSSLPLKAEDCSAKEGEDAAWCVAYSASSADGCLRIDDTQYPDEAAFCRARAAGNQSLCVGIQDAVLENMCRKTVLGL
jgi:hypothetical protein